ncbi:MAG: hypothetical protein EAZ21_15715 [Betaproteobacteria bacterium]|nr:MAG: hypothetical protein EAZ43_01420 [Betaproteobacteria bacterium]TAG76989.1 MAG: hypothetical protein EAZ21_15715 [Betaproteobacteria bacterium]
MPKHAQRRTLLGAVAAAPWWWAAFVGTASAQSSTAGSDALDERVRAAALVRGGLSLDIPVIVETGTSVPIVLFADPSQLRPAVRVTRLGIIAPKNPRPVALDMELGALMSQARIATNIRLGASQSVTGVALLSDGTVWQQSIAVVLTGSACYDGT